MSDKAEACLGQYVGGRGIKVRIDSKESAGEDVDLRLASGVGNNGSVDSEVISDYTLWFYFTLL